MWKVFVYTFLSPPPSLGGKKQTQDSGQTPTPHSIFFRREKWKQFKTFKKSSIHTLQWEEIFWWLFTLSIGMVKPIWFMFSSKMKKFWTTFNLLPHSICFKKRKQLRIEEEEKTKSNRTLIHKEWISLIFFYYILFFLIQLFWKYLRTILSWPLTRVIILVHLLFRCASISWIGYYGHAGFFITADYEIFRLWSNNITIRIALEP